MIWSTWQFPYKLFLFCVLSKYYTKYYWHIILVFWLNSLIHWLNSLIHWFYNSEFYLLSFTFIVFLILFSFWLCLCCIFKFKFLFCFIISLLLIAFISFAFNFHPYAFLSSFCSICVFNVFLNRPKSLIRPINSAKYKAFLCNNLFWLFIIKLLIKFNNDCHWELFLITVSFIIRPGHYM